MVILEWILSDPAALTRLERVFDRIQGAADKYDSSEISRLAENTGVTNKVEPSREAKSHFVDHADVHRHSARDLFVLFIDNVLHFKYSKDLPSISFFSVLIFWDTIAIFVENKI